MIRLAVAAVVMLLVAACAPNGIVVNGEPRDPRASDAAQATRPRLSDAIVAPTNAQDAKPIAEEVHIDLVPSYFFKPVAGTALVTMASSVDNVLVDLSTAPPTVQRIPGSYDPIPSFPDGRLIAIPGNGLALYTISALLEDGLQARPFFVSKNGHLDGIYQSIGVLDAEPLGTVYRIAGLSRNDSKLWFQDLRVRFEDEEPVNVDELGYARPLCGNLEPEHVALPVLSKNGRELGVLYKGRTRIYRIDGTDCNEVVDLGIPTGKVDFSFDGRRLAFHIGRSTAATTSTPHSPQRRAGLAVWTLDRLEPSTLAEPVRLSPALAGNAYYPAFLEDGRVIYLRAVPAGDTRIYKFVFQSPNDAPDSTLLETFKMADRL